MSLSFWKFTGAGNDFVTFDNRSGAFEPDTQARAALIRTLCARGTGVGADGALILEPSQKGDFRMRYYNSDGGEAETCGNGARCIARFANLLGVTGQTCRIETMAGIYEAVVKPDAVRVSMSDAFGLELDVCLNRDTLPADLLSGIPSLHGSGTVDFINTGVPHVVIRVEDLEDVAVVELGRVIRYHARFAPAGTNVDFIAPAGSNHFAIRTYERGVEDETLACGTGCIASAIVACRRELAAPPVRLTTRSGVDLLVHLVPAESGATRVQLEGEARLVFKGELP